MKKLVIFAALVVTLQGLSGCESYYYDDDGWHDYHHGWWGGYPGGYPYYDGGRRGGWGHGGDRDGGRGGGGWGHGGGGGRGGAPGHGGGEPVRGVGPGSGGWGHGGHRVDIETNDPVLILANRYNVQAYTAEDILEFAARKDKAKALAEMGVTAKEMRPVAKLKMPDEDTIQKMAAHLKEDPDKIRDIWADFISDIRAEKQAERH